MVVSDYLEMTPIKVRAGYLDSPNDKRHSLSVME